MNMWYWNNLGMNIFQWYDLVMNYLNWKRERWRRWGQHRVQVNTLAHDSDTCRGPEIQKYEITAQSKQYKCKNTKIQKINAKGLISQNYKISAERKKRTHKTQCLSRIPTATWNAFHIFDNCQRDEECKCCAKRLQPPLLCPDLVHTIAQSLQGNVTHRLGTFLTTTFFQKGNQIVHFHLILVPIAKGKIDITLTTTNLKVTK